MSVVQFPKPEKLIWRCAHCGCATFYLYSDSSVECAGCEHTSDGGEWVSPIANGPRKPEESIAGSLSVVAIGSVELAKKRVLKKLAARANDITLVAAWFEDGEMSTWSSAETEEQKQAHVVLLDELAIKIARKPVDGE